ncbi:MAG: hypothetical protein SNF33_00250 (plasmid) [Candidatus Algichlamydia australiensis]|nr:hypothetical protein [Chlamydiales bacterium]
MRRFLIFVHALIFTLPSIGEAKNYKGKSSSMILNPSYNCIRVSCYFVNKKRLSEVFSTRGNSFAQQPIIDLDKEQLYLLVRCRNRGYRTAYGTLRLEIPNRKSPILINIDQMKPRMNYTHDYVFRIDGRRLLKGERPPRVEFSWDCLYTTDKDCCQTDL